MAEIVVNKENYHVKGHYSHSKQGRRIWVKPHNVNSSSFLIKDRGRKGAGPYILPQPKAGGLGGKGFFKKTHAQQIKIVFNVAKKKGEKTAMGRLSDIAGFMKRTNPTDAQRALKLKTEVAGSFIGKKRVKYPSGFSHK